MMLADGIEYLVAGVFYAICVCRMGQSMPVQPVWCFRRKRLETCECDRTYHESWRWSPGPGVSWILIDRRRAKVVTDESGDDVTANSSPEVRKHDGIFSSAFSSSRFLYGCEQTSLSWRSAMANTTTGTGKWTTPGNFRYNGLVIIVGITRRW
jgi:hypothetical protein